MGHQLQSASNAGPPLAIVVLGCRVQGGAPGGALRRRLSQALVARATWPDVPVIMSGGRLWEGHAEARVMERWWSENEGNGILITEEKSLTTRQNAREVGRLCREMGYRHVVLVTCDFHMPRARRLFESQGLRVTSSPARVERSIWERWRLSFREWGAAQLSRWEGLMR